jgi:DNA-binding transcriptional ArsR family regulator
MKPALKVNPIKSASETNGVCAVPCFKEELVRKIKGWLPDDSEVRRVATLHGALADPSRLKILLALSRGELCVCDVSHVVGLSISATSHQLRLLRNLNLVSYRNDGKMAYYSLTGDAFVISWIRQTLDRQR